MQATASHDAKRVAAPSPLSDVPFERLDVFRESTECDRCGTQLRLVREEAARFRKEFILTGTPEYVETFDLATVPYPTAFGLFRAHRSLAPLLSFTNRVVVVRFRDRGGSRKTLVFEPTDVELAENAPFYRQLSKKIPKPLRRFGVKRFGDTIDHLRRIGIDPAEVDYLAFDHLHVQDVRRLIGTRGPARDISPDAPMAPLFPNAKLVVQRSEFDLIREMHPLQSAWYQPETFRDLRPETLLIVEGDFLLGPGVALISTPGHASGNQSLVLNTSTGIWAFSENVIAAELLTPDESKIPGVRQYAKKWNLEVVLNGNTIENTAQQYNSIVKEKCIVDRSLKNSRFLQFFPTSELTASFTSPGTKPTFVHGKLTHGKLVREA